MKLLLSVLLLLSLTAKANTYYFSDITGDDSRSSAAAQNSSTPWKSINKFNSFGTGFVAGDIILFKAGETFYTNTGMIIKSNGSVSAPIYIGSYGTGAKPLITSMIDLTFTAAPGTNLWRSNETITMANLNMVTADDVPVEMGRWPNRDNGTFGYNTIQSIDTHSPYDTIVDASGLGGKPSSIKIYAGATIVIKPEKFWVRHYPIVSYNPSTYTIRYTNTTQTESASKRVGKGWFIENDSTTLDQQNEWWVNTTANYLKVYSVGAPTNIQVATSDNLFWNNATSDNTGQGKSYITVEGIEFDGCNGEGIDFIKGNRDNRRFTFNNNFLHNTGKEGLSGCWNDSYITNNTITNTLCTAVDMIVTSSTVSRKNYITNNFIQYVHQLPGHGNNSAGDASGIGTKSFGTVIKFNSVQNTGYCGITGGKSDSVIIDSNYVANVMNVLDDGGAIYFYTGNDGTISYGREVIGNVVLHGLGAPGGGTTFVAGAGVSGLYMDLGTTGVLISGNYVEDFEKGIFLNYGNSFVTVTKNTVYDASAEAVKITTRSTGRTRNLRVTKNILYITTTTAVPMSLYNDAGSDPGGYTSFGTIDSNYYIRPLAASTPQLRYATGYSSSGGSQNIFTVSMATWRSMFPYDDHSTLSPFSYTSYAHMIDSSLVAYNASNSSINQFFSGTRAKLTAESYTSYVTIPAHNNVVLFRVGDAIIIITNQKIKTNRRFKVP